MNKIRCIVTGGSGFIDTNIIQVDAEYTIDNTRKICEKLPYGLDKSVYITLQWMYKHNMIHNKPTQL